MPIEIKELNIRISVSGGPPPAVRSGQRDGAGGADSGAHGAGKDEIVAECVEQVLQVLRARKER
jgi:Family of unknown function (DUF5908)